MVATDFSERSDRAIRRATLLAKQTGGELSLVHVVDDDQPERIVEAEREAASRLLYEQSATLKNIDGIKCHTSVILAAPFDGIVQAAMDRAPDLLIIGSHRRQMLRNIFVGTTAERTIRSVSCPVLMANSPPVGPYRNVLLTTDLSDNAHSAIVRFTSLGISANARTAVVYAFDAPALRLGMSHSLPKDDKEYYVERVRRDAMDRLSQFADTCGLGRSEHIVRHEASNPADEILKVAQDIEAGLIVIGTHGRSGLARLFLGSVAQEILRNATADVLTVPPQCELQRSDMPGVTR
jgi:nucleotide-binding universal stress UspA family protein